MTRQYVLRSENQGKTWELLPGRRHGGWYVRGPNRMDAGRPIDLSEGRLLMMIRSPEGHLWQAWSEDDGKSWTDPAASPLIPSSATMAAEIVLPKATSMRFGNHAKTPVLGRGANLPFLCGVPARLCIRSKHIDDTPLAARSFLSLLGECIKKHISLSPQFIEHFAG